MYLLTRILPFLTAVFVVAGGELAIARPTSFIPAFALMVVVLLGVGLMILRKSSWNEKVALTVSPMVFLAGSAFVTFFLSPSWFIHFVLIIIGGSLWVYFEELFRYAHEPERYHQHAIEHLASYFGIVALASSMGGVFALRIFLDVRLVYLLPITMIIATIISASIFSVQPLSRVSLISSSVVFGLLATEMTWAVHFLPTHYWVDSLIVTIPFYVALHIVRHEMNGTLNQRIVRRYASIGILGLSAVLVTAQWVL